MSRAPVVPANSAADPRTNHVPSIQTTGATFEIFSAKLYVPAVTLSINDDSISLDNIKQGFRRIVSCNKYRSEKNTQPIDNNLDYMMDPTFRNINNVDIWLHEVL